MATAKQVQGKSLDAFRAAHDKTFIVPKRIRDALESLGDSWEYELEFLRRSGLSTVDLAAYREGFTDFYVEVALPGRSASTKRVWAGTKKFASQLRAKIG